MLVKRGLRRGREDYLRVIYEMGLGINERVKSIEIAAKLGVSKPSVSEMLRKLADEKLILLKKYSRVTLTQKGMKQGEILHDKHLAVKSFLGKLRNRRHEEVLKEAHELEHGISDETLEGIDRIMHGKSIKDVPCYVG